MVAIPIEIIQSLEGKITCNGDKYYFRQNKRTGRVIVQRCPTKSTEKQRLNRIKFALLYAGNKNTQTDN